MDQLTRITSYFDNKIAWINQQRERSISLARFLDGKTTGSKFVINDIECMITEVDLRENAYFVICPINSTHDIGNGAGCMKKITEWS